MHKQWSRCLRFSLWVCLGLAPLLLVVGVASQSPGLIEFSPQFTVNGFFQSGKHPYNLFLQRSSENPALRMLVFVDGVTGESTTLLTSGERYMIFGRSVLYWDTQTNHVMMVSLDVSSDAHELQPHEHPFMQPDPGAKAVDWIVTPDGKRLAWTITRDLGNQQLMTITRTALADGTDQRDLLIDVRSDGLRVMPVTFDHTQSQVILDYQPDGIAALTPYPQYAG